LTNREHQISELEQRLQFLETRNKEAMDDLQESCRVRDDAFRRLALLVEEVRKMREAKSQNDLASTVQGEDADPQRPHTVDSQVKITT